MVDIDTQSGIPKIQFRMSQENFDVEAVDFRFCRMCPI